MPLRLTSRLLWEFGPTAIPALDELKNERRLARWRAVIRDGTCGGVAPDDADAAALKNAAATVAKTIAQQVNPLAIQCVEADLQGTRTASIVTALNLLKELSETRCQVGCQRSCRSSPSKALRDTSIHKSSLKRKAAKFYVSSRGPSVGRDAVCPPAATAVGGDHRREARAHLVHAASDGEAMEEDPIYIRTRLETDTNCVHGLDRPTHPGLNDFTLEYVTDVCTALATQNRGSAWRTIVMSYTCTTVILRLFAMLYVLPEVTWTSHWPIEGLPETLRYVYVQHEGIVESQGVDVQGPELVHQIPEAFMQKMLDDEFDALSGGWRMKLAVARAMLYSADVLLLNESTNHLDVHAVQCWWTT
ncbi:LOW QUALITY PROTEIN: Elongation factor 3-like protein ABCF transporter [Phytophthora megakarya]|uniref:Elongation factor 3-like protein ABCF transporter n=1 Tax=Phytophthora megakarya TaxID=4795 RepID=A0A225W5M1_9STRA|nr:LOW QUALITY PROTEIN: Elongation factor 3-like protein ABCF transporter [Phytophthora megakarya]